MHSIFEGREVFWLHPEWIASWRSSWAQFASGLHDKPAADQVAHLTVDGVGCCGPIGAVSCPRGHSLGHMFGDCTGAHWLGIDPAAVNRSDTGDGWWTLFELPEGPDVHVMEGMMVKGRPDGD